MRAIAMYCEVCGRHLPLTMTRIGNRCLGCENAPMSPWMVGDWYRDTEDSDWNDALNIICEQARCASSARSTYLDSHEASATIDFMVELVHEIGRLQTENIKLEDVLNRDRVDHPPSNGTEPVWPTREEHETRSKNRR